MDSLSVFFFLFLSSFISFSPSIILPNYLFVSELKRCYGWRCVAFSVSYWSKWIAVVKFCPVAKVYFCLNHYKILKIWWQMLQMKGLFFVLDILFDLKNSISIYIHIHNENNVILKLIVFISNYWSRLKCRLLIVLRHWLDCVKRKPTSSEWSYYLRLNNRNNGRPENSNIRFTEETSSTSCFFTM